jgi:RyR domain-containing protein
MIDDNETLIEACIRAAYEVNRAYCIALGDLSFGPWEQAPDWQKASLRQGLVGAIAGNTPEQSHESWLAEKRATGWKYGPVKDPEKKEHPCIVPYAGLPAAQRAKDELYLTVVRAMTKALMP